MNEREMWFWLTIASLAAIVTMLVIGWGMTP